MTIRNESTSSHELLLDARYHLAALLSDPEAESLAPLTRKSIQTLRDAWSAADTQEGERIERQALYDRADLVLDKRTRQLDLEVLALVGGQRGDERYRQIFPRGASVIIAMRGAEEAAALESVLSALQSSQPALFKRHEAELRKLAQAASEAEKALLKAEAAADQAFTTELAARRALVRQLQKNEGALRSLFPGDRAAVRSFFRSTKRRAEAVEEGPEPAAGATPDPKTDQ